MFKRILVPLDLSDKHERALGIAATLANQDSASVFLFHVVETIPGLTVAEEKDFYSRLERTAQAHLRRSARSLQRRGVGCRTKVSLGHRVRETAQFAKRVKADLIILTAPPFDRSHPVGGLGSMSWKIGMVAPCPVLLVK